MSTQSYSFFLVFRFRLPKRLHSSCSISQTGGWTQQNITTDWTPHSVWSWCLISPMIPRLRGASSCPAQSLRRRTPRRRRTCCIPHRRRPRRPRRDTRCASCSRRSSRSRRRSRTRGRLCKWGTVKIKDDRGKNQILWHSDFVTILTSKITANDHILWQICHYDTFANSITISDVYCTRWWHDMSL